MIYSCEIESINQRNHNTISIAPITVFRIAWLEYWYSFFIIIYVYILGHEQSSPNCGFMNRFRICEYQWLLIINCYKILHHTDDIFTQLKLMIEMKQPDDLKGELAWIYGKESLRFPLFSIEDAPIYTTPSLCDTVATCRCWGRTERHHHYRDENGSIIRYRLRSVQVPL